MKIEDYEDYEGNLLFEEDFLESFDDAESIKNILKDAGNSDEIMEIRRQEKIMQNIYQELKGKNNPVIHNFVCDKNLKNHNIKLGIIFYSSEDVAALKNHEERISIKILAGLIYDLIINNIEFANLTPINLPSNLTPARNIRNTKTYARASFNPQDIKNHNHNFANVKNCIAFFFYNKNLSCYKNVKDLVIEKIFSINENYININVL